MSLPIFQSPVKELVQMETVWAAHLNPLLSFTPNNGLVLQNITLVNGTNVINHKLGRMMQGWVITDINAGAAIYRSASFSDKTLTLTSGAGCMVSLWVF